MRRILLLMGLLAAAGCGGDPPPPPAQSVPADPPLPTKPPKDGNMALPQ